MRNALTIFSFAFLVSCHLSSFATIDTITVQNHVFTPESINAAVGDTIFWMWVNPNGNGGSHTTTDSVIPPDATSWSANINSGTTTFAYVLTVPGTYYYHCNFHWPMGMHGAITVSGTSGISSVSAPGDINAYPQPCSNDLTIDLANSEPFKKGLSLEIFDVSGQRKFQTNYSQLTDNKIVLDMSSFASGIYFINLQSNGEQRTIKVLKM